MYVCKIYKRVSRNETDDHDGMYFFCSLGDLPPTTGKTIRGNNQPFKYKHRPETAPGSPETACRLGSAQSTCKGGGEQHHLVVRGGRPRSRCELLLAYDQTTTTKQTTKCPYVSTSAGMLSTALSVQILNSLLSVRSVITTTAPSSPCFGEGLARVTLC